MKARRHAVITTTLELSAEDVQALVAEIGNTLSPALMALRRMLVAPTEVDEPIPLTANMVIANGDDLNIVNPPLEEDYGQVLVADAERKREPTEAQKAEAELMRQRYPDAIGAAGEIA